MDINMQRQRRSDAGISRRRVIGATACLGAIGLPIGVSAQAWPATHVHWILPFPAGNGVDVVARLIGDRVSTRLGQPIVIENRPGGSGVIGVSAVARAAADGYTFAIASVSPITILPAIRKHLPYDPLQHLVPISLLATGPNVIVVRKDLPVSNLKELVVYCRANAGKVKTASLGVGTISNMSTKVFTRSAGIDLTEVSYKGSTQALADLMGGHIDMQNDSLQSTLAQVNAGTIKALAVTSLKRSALLPNVPAVSESGLPGLESYDYYGWIGAFAPVGVSQRILNRMHSELQSALTESEVRSALFKAALDVSPPLTQEQFKEFVAADYEKWRRLASQLGVEVTS